MIHRKVFGEIKVGDFCQTIYSYTLDNGIMSVDVLSFGATIASIKLPEREGKKTDVVLGFSSLKGYQADYNPYFGAIVGRVCNRIANGTFKVKKKIYRVSINQPPNTLNGGFHGLDKKIWDVDVDGERLIFSSISYHMEEGFPGTIQAKAIYELNAENELKLEMRAKTTHPTPINLSNHSYFNLAGHETGWHGMKDHYIRINADKHTPSDEHMIPTGEILPVRGSNLDLRERRNLAKLINKSPNNGYDNNFVLNGTGMKFVARAFHSKTGRTLEVYSDQPCVQFCTGDSISNALGKNRVVYNKHAGICFATQNFPNAVNTPSFPNSILEPGDEYVHLLAYRFLF